MEKQNQEGKRKGAMKRLQSQRKVAAQAAQRRAAASKKSNPQRSVETDAKSNPSGGKQRRGNAKGSPVASQRRRVKEVAGTGQFRAHVDKSDLLVALLRGFAQSITEVLG